MVKKIMSIGIALLMILGLCSCGSANSDGAKKYGYDQNDLENMIAFMGTTSEKHCGYIEERSGALTEELGETYESYLNNNAKITEFYTKAIADLDEVIIALDTVTNDYYQCVAKDHFSEYKIWNEAMEDVYDSWNNAMESYYETWNDSFEDLYDICDDLVKLGSDKLPYKEYSKAFAEMRKEYSGAWSDMYGKYSGAWRDLFKKHSDVWSEFYNGENDIEEILYSKDKEDEKDNESGDVLTSADVTSLESLEDFISNETEGAINTIAMEYETLKADITTYAEYVTNVSKIEAFYEKIEKTSEQIANQLCQHSVTYAEKIMNSGMSTDEMYDALDGIYDGIYDDAGDILYNGIYDGILDDAYNDFYDGVLDDRDESVSYSEWSKARSDEYKMWSNTRSDCYKQWSNMRSDVYGFWSDMRSKMYSDDVEKAKKILNDFKEDVQKMLG